MTELVARLSRRRLATEETLVTPGRGRPSTKLLPHPDGPLVLTAEISASGWRTASAGVDGRAVIHEERNHQTYQAEIVLAAVERSLKDLHAQAGERAVTVSVAVAGTLHGTTVVQSAALGWEQVDLGSLAIGLPLVSHNDATSAGVAEARKGASRGAEVATHLLVLSGTGGSTCVNGIPLTGASGAGDEYGHLPFGRPDLLCDCGARGCWEVDLGARALAKNLGLTDLERAEEVATVRSLLDGLDPAQPTPRAVAESVISLARGSAGLVNALDPAVVTLGGIAIQLRRAAPELFHDSFMSGLMSYRRPNPPTVLDGRLGTEAALLGAIELGLDNTLTPAALAHWASSR